MTFSKQICRISELHFIFMNINMHSAVIVMVPKAIVREAPEKWTLECHILTQIILSSLTFHFLC